MRYYDYSKTQLENEADSLNESFDKERLIRPKKIDVYDVVDFIHCTPDWFYLSPDQSILGMTAYNNGYYYAWIPISEADGLHLTTSYLMGCFLKDSCRKRNYYH